MPTYTNLVILQGWLEIEEMTAIIIQREQVPVLKGWVHTTDRPGLEDVFEERHPILISGRAAEAVLEITRKLSDKLPYTADVGLVHLAVHDDQTAQVLTNQGRPFVIAQGRLLSQNGHSCVDVRHISVLGLPWGALDTLSNLEPDFPANVQAILTELTATEKTQIGQAVGVAMRSLVALRCDGSRAVR
jgi:hypothetical protein